MTDQPSFFFCGIGGSGMLPLAMILKARGFEVEGSDRSRDQGKSAEKFAFLESAGIRLHPQDGSGVRAAGQSLVVSAAIEETVPDVAAARRVGAAIQTRAELLSDLFNRSAERIGVAGTSGKSTTTGMIGWMLQQAGRAPTIMNGAVMTNFVTPDLPFASAVIGTDQLFVSEVDESDGSIARFDPTIAVINNIALDHKPMEELRALFSGFAARARLVVLNLDNIETCLLAKKSANACLTYSRSNPAADLLASRIQARVDGISFEVRHRTSGDHARLDLKMPGRHNVSNALAALGAGLAAGLDLANAARCLEGFGGIRRRMEVVGTAAGITIFDDFAHNPDKIAASLDTLHDFPGRLLVMFQPHGFGPLRLMRSAYVEGFVRDLATDDMLLMPEPYFAGGTTDRSVGSADLVADLVQAGKRAEALPDRQACGQRLLDLAHAGDRILIMGARDDTLTDFAHDLWQQLNSRKN